MLKSEPPVTSSGSRSSASLEAMIGLYEACVHVREISRQQYELADEMALIATNAGIAAAKSTLNKEAFNVLAYETGQIARHMGQSVAAIQDDANLLARHSLLGLEKSRQLDQLQEGLSGIQRPSNSALVGQVVDKVHTLVSRTFATLCERLDHLEEGQQAIGRHLVKVSRISTYFRIEASRDPQYGAYFLNIAEDLARLCQSASSIAEAMQQVLRRASA